MSAYRDELLELLKDVERQIVETQRLVVEFSAEDPERERVAERLHELRCTAKRVEESLKEIDDVV